MQRILLIFVLAAGCSSGKADLSNEAIDLDSDLKSDLWKRTQFLGNFALGRGSKAIAYHSPPKYRSFSFNADGGNTVDLWVRSGDGDAVAWLFDYKGKLIRYNDDADDSTYDSHIHVKLPPSNGFYYVYFREYSEADATFGFSLARAPETGLAGRAQGAWESSADSLDSYQVKWASLPAAALAQRDADAAHGGTLTAYALPVGSDTVYVVYGSQEEYAWLDIFSSTGKFLVHGECGDGGFDVTAWGGVIGPHY